MCTLTYLPLPNGYIFTHNRDERMDRPTTPHFVEDIIGGVKVFFPKDLEAQGTWFAFSESNKAACLLNGGSHPHQRKLPYRHSRGLVVLDSFKHASATHFYQGYNFNNLEPFTLLLKDQTGLFQITHDTAQTTINQINSSETQIWSSSMLYTPQVRIKRKHWFDKWRQSNNQFTANGILNFHLQAGDGDSENDLLMSRWGILKTLSVSQISTNHEKAELLYKDFISGSEQYLTQTLKG